MNNYTFDFDRFQQLNGKLCPCLMPNKENSIIENMCPCHEFMTKGKCRCNLFKTLM